MGARVMIERSETRQNRQLSSEDGAILPLIAGGLTVLLLFVALVIDQGILFSGRGQLQHAADAGVRAGLMEASARAENLSGGQMLSEGRRVAMEVINGTTIIDGGVSDGDVTFEFGSYTRLTGFIPNTSLIGAPQAARVTTSRVGSNGFESIFDTGANLQANAVSVAVFQCRNVVLLQDTSASFRRERAEAVGGLRRAIDQVYSNPYGGDGKLVIIGFAGEDLRNNNLSSGGISPIFDIDGFDGTRSQAQAYVDSLRFCNAFSCLGTNMASGFREARRVLTERIDNDCVDIVVLLSDGAPCPFGFNGSSKTETRTERNRLVQAGISVAPIFLNRNENDDDGDPATEDIECPTEAADPNFLADMASGFGQILKAAIEVNAIAIKVDMALNSIPPVLVE